MKKFIFVLALAFLAATNTHTQSPGVSLLTGNSQSGILDSYDGEAITFDNTAGGVGFTAAKISPTCTDCPLNVLRATRADCTTDPAAFSIRVLANGTAPTTTVGLLIAAGQSFTVFGYDNIAAFRGIRTAGTSVTAYCVYSRPF